VPKVQIVAEPNSGRGHRGRRVATSLAEINVVPLVDVMLVLLIIFMVTAPLIQRGVDVNLPVTTRSSQIVGTRVFVTVPSTYRQSRMVFLDDDHELTDRARHWIDGVQAQFASVPIEPEAPSIRPEPFGFKML